jgi:hypothetical protein
VLVVVLTLVAEILLLLLDADHFLLNKLDLSILLSHMNSDSIIYGLLHAQLVSLVRETLLDSLLQEGFHFLPHCAN